MADSHIRAPLQMHDNPIVALGGRGLAALGGTIDPGNRNTYAITFDEPFDAPPHIIGTLDFGTAVKQCDVNWYIADRTTTGFTVVVANNGLVTIDFGTNEDSYFHYLATDVPAASTTTDSSAICAAI